MNLSDRDYDDLTVIRGIGPARQRWLRDSLDVRTFADLAALSVDEIESRLKADKQIASRGTIEVWITAARERAAAAGGPKQLAGVSAGKESQEQARDSAEPNKIDSRREKPVPSKDGWKPFASFVIEFQERSLEGQATEYRTTAHHMEADTGTNWPGIEAEAHCRWMLGQLGDRVSIEPARAEEPLPEPAAPGAPVARQPVQVHISQIRAFQPPRAASPVGTGTPGQPFEGLLKENQPFSLEILFNLVGEAAADLAQEQAIFRARAYVQDQSTGTSTHLGDTEPGTLAEGELAYAAVLRALTLPPGAYRLYALVTLQAVSVKPDFVTLPVFEVAR